MNYSHYSAKPFQFEASRIYKQGHHKPRGLWLSVDGDDDWRSWCIGESWGLEGLAWKTKITLSRRSTCLLITSTTELDKFSRNYGNNDEHDVGAIHWPDVFNEYDGIIIAPYLWQRRLDVMWYYVWDCASGCIWNLAAIDKVGESIEQEQSQAAA